MIRHDILFYIWLAQTFPFGHALPSTILNYYKNDIYKFYENIELEAKNFNITKKRLEKLKAKKLTDYVYILELCKKLNIKIICYTDEKYPERLKNIKNPPIVLYYVGNLNITFTPCIGVVGTRRCNNIGMDLCRKLTKELISHKITIVSGCSKGIDTVAHKTAVEEAGKTIAILGTSLETPYPLENKELKKDIIKTGGLIFSEYPPKTETSAWLFPIRNRLISALSDGVVVIQSPEKSGAIITAKLAIDQKKPLFCLPPMDIFDSVNYGNKKCLKNGAKMLLEIADILEIYENLKYKPQKVTQINLPQKKQEKEIPENFKKLFNIIGQEKRLDEILRVSEYPPSKTLIMLTQMELINLLKRTRDGYKRC